MAPGRQVRNMAVPMAYASSRSAKTTSRTTTGKRFPSRGQSLDVFELDEKHARGRRANGEDGEEANYEIQSVAIDSADDEEISEDEAFDDEDEERWGDFFRGSATEAQKPEKSGGISLYEDDDALDNDDDNESDDEDAVDISELLNDGSDQRAASSNLLVDFVNSLDSTTRATSKQQQQQRKRKQAEPDEERESALLTTSGSVSLSMLAGLAGATEGGDLPGGHLGKRIKQIYRGEGKSEAVSAPLAPALQQRIERETAYDASAREVSKWMPIVAKNRQAEHLEFPLNVTSKQTLSSASLASTFKPSTTLEEEVNSILTQSGLATEKGIMHTELELNQLDPAELQRQRAELQKMRSLLFHAELKVKRHSKIKSKKFHRIRNRERERQKGGDVDGENMDDAERMELERQRAEERMSMRHGKGSTWAKSLAGVNAGQDDETRQAILARLDTQERLRRKIKGTDSNDDGDDDREETEQGTTNASREETASTANAPLSGLLAMKFMRNRNGTAEVVETGFGDSDDDAANAAVGTNSGRMSFGNASSLPASNRGSPPAAKNRASGAPTLDESRFTSAKAVPLIGGAGVPAQEKVAALGSSATGSSAADLTSAHRPVEDFAAQRHLIEMAFALDDVVDKTFEAEKEKTIEQGLPSAGANASGAMPGWGHWAGAGIAPRSTKSPNADAERTAQLRSAAAKRKDARLKHVIISEQRDKKFSNKYNADQVPFPYKSKEQYEAMMRNPLGKEWNAVASHQRLTKPRVITKIGTVIDPLTFTKQPKDGQSSNY